MHIGILQCGHLPDDLQAEFGEYGTLYPKLLAGQGFEFSVWSVVDSEFPGTVSDADGWLLTGSRHGAYDDLPWIAPLEQFIRDAYAAAVPMVGICFGHQIIAQAMGGKVEKFAGGWSVGPQNYRFSNGLGDLSLNAWHQDQVTQLPEDAEVIGDSPFCANAALIYGNRAYSVQPHPEFEPDFVAGLIASRGRGVVPDPQLDEASQQLDRPLDNQAMADSFAAFFRRSRPAAA